MRVGMTGGRLCGFAEFDIRAIAFASSQKTLPIGILIATDTTMFGNPDLLGPGHRHTVRGFSDVDVSCVRKLFHRYRYCWTDWRPSRPLLKKTARKFQHYNGLLIKIIQHKHSDTAEQAGPKVDLPKTSGTTPSPVAPLAAVNSRFLDRRQVVVNKPQDQESCNQTCNERRDIPV